MHSIDHFFDENNNIKYPNKVDKSDPAKTPILTPSIYSMFSTKAKFPTNKLIVKPIPVKTDTPYKLNQFELSGICAAPTLTATKEKIITPTCFPINNPRRIPSGTGCNNDDKDKPSNETPALANANIGIIIKATYGLIACSILINKE